MRFFLTLSILIPSVFIAYLATGGIWSIQTKFQHVWRLNKLTGEVTICTGGKCWKPKAEIDDPKLDVSTVTPVVPHRLLTDEEVFGTKALPQISPMSVFRKKYPEYADLTNQQLADILYRKFYFGIPRAEYNRQLGL